MIRSFKIFILLIFFLNYSYSQNSNIKSIPDDTNKVLQLIDIANQFSWNTPDSQIFYASIAIEISEKISFSKGLFWAYSTIASACYVNGNYVLGLSSAQKALIIARKQNNPNWISRICNAIGLLYQQIKKYKESIEYFNEAINYVDTINNKVRYASTCNNIANSYLYLNDFEKSFFYRMIALNIRKTINDISALADTYNDIGETYLLANQNDSALNYFQICFKIKDSINDLEMKALSANNLANCFFIQKKFSLAKYYSNIALSIADTINAPYYKLEALNRLLKISEFENNKIKEIIYLKEILNLKDTLYNIENQKQTNRLYFEFETEKKELQIKNLETKQQAAKKQFIIILFFSILIFTILTVFLIIIQKRYSIIKFQKLKIEEQHIILQNKNKEILDSINYAYLIQKALITSQGKLTNLLINQLKMNNIVLFFKPRDIVSGDFYWAEKSNNDIYLAVCDSTGHGVPGAFMSVLNINLLYEAIRVRDISKTNEILTYIRLMLKKNISYSSEQNDGMDGCLIKFNVDMPYKIEYSAAFNCPVIVRNNEIIELKADRKPIGNSLHDDNFNLYSFELHQNDSIYCFSDGYHDQIGGKDEKKLYKRNFYNILKSIATKSSNQQTEYLENFLNTFMGDRKQIDDILVLGIIV